MGNFKIYIGNVVEIENTNSNGAADALRIRARIDTKDSKEGKDRNSIPWAFPMMPKIFQSVPKEGEAVFLFVDETDTTVRYYLGPIISQPQYFLNCAIKDATTLFKNNKRNPIEKISNDDNTNGAFPNSNDVAVIGRGKEDIILRYDSNTSEIDLRAGIRGEATGSGNPNMVGNVIFNNMSPAYIQLKYKNSLTKAPGTAANSIINIVADKINLMSHNDLEVSHNLTDKKTLVEESKLDEIMGNLHPAVKGDVLVRLLELIVGSVLHHVHPWAGMEQCGDWSGFVNQLRNFPINNILSEDVRLS